jgi:integrase
VRYWVGDQRRWELQPKGTTRRQAQARLAQLATASARGELPRQIDIPFDAYAQQWVEEQEALCRAGVLKPSTYRDRETTVRIHLTPFFGNLALDQITKADCRAFQLAKVKQGTLTPTTINGRMRVLNAILNHAVDADLIPRNPGTGIKRLRAHPRAAQYYEAEEAHRLIQATPKPWRALITIAAFAGLRQGEILALRWADINWTTNRIHVRTTLQRPDKLLGHEASPLTPPKSAKSIREVPMRPIVREQLEAHKRDHAIPNPLDLIFPNDAGQPADAHNLVRRVYHPAIHRAGLHQIRFHDLRHTFVTYCAAAGVPQEQVRDWIGHTDTRTTEIYRATSQGAEAFALKALDLFDEFAAPSIRKGKDRMAASDVCESIG